MPYPAEHINCTCIGAGPPVLMIHGNPATASLWRPLAERVSTVRTVYLVDLPGFGGTPPPSNRSDYSLRSLMEALLAFADLHGLDRFDLVGHSFGGAIAIALAAAQPERIRTLTAITPMTDDVPALARLARNTVLRSAVASAWSAVPGRMRRWAIRNWAHVSYGSGYSAARAGEIAREGDRPDLLRSAGNLIAEADYTWYGGMIDRLGRHRTPPLLLIGAGRDRIVPYAHFLHLQTRLSHAVIHTFSESGHVPMWQYPDPLAEIVQEFWERHGGGEMV